MVLPPDILARSPVEASRRIALIQLEKARKASRRLDDPADRAALHDFRVATRRLRSTLRAWKRPLGKSASKTQRRALRVLQNATGGGRDAEVALEWLATQSGTLQPEQRVGHAWLIDHLEHRRAEAMEHAREGVRAQFDRIGDELARGLEVPTVSSRRVAPAGVGGFGEALASKARDCARELTRLVTAVSSPEDESTCHRARIACKRLRYLLEPLRPHADGAPAIVERCERLQDLLGELHDAHVLREELRSAAERAGHELARGDGTGGLHAESHPSPRPGLLELTRRVEARIAHLFAELRGDWIEGSVHSLLADVEILAVRLERAVDDEVEIEEKLLLRNTD
jgi:CHAD domain-containing protein